jgi:hypothetical protein
MSSTTGAPPRETTPVFFPERVPPSPRGSARARRRGARRRDVARAPDPAEDFSLFPTASTTGHTPRQTRHRGLRPRTRSTRGSDACARSRRPCRARSLARDARGNTARPPIRPRAHPLAASRAVTPRLRGNASARANPPGARGALGASFFAAPPPLERAPPARLHRPRPKNPPNPNTRTPHPPRPSSAPAWNAPAACATSTSTTSPRP